MRTTSLVLTLVSVLSVTCTQAKIGHFWHITDFHYDPLYSPYGDTRKHCRRTDERGSSGHHRSLGRFGDYSCDSSLALIESASLHMRTKHPDNVEFVLWTGDTVAGGYGGAGGDKDERLEALRNMTDLLGRTFSSQFVFPVLGHLDPPPSAALAQLWMQWLPTEALITFQDGGYYTIEQSHSKLRIVALNTNLLSARAASAEVSLRQWDWLDQVLTKAVQLKEMVYIVGHAPPGSDERRGETGLAYTPEANRRYLRTVRKYARVIAGQFYGHLHSDTFRVVYDNDKPTSWAMVAPSVSPRRNSVGPTNPALRLYKFDTDSGKVLDYTQYYLELGAANRNSGPAEWQAEYNLTQYYGLHEVTPNSLHSLAEKIGSSTPQESSFFHKYIRANTARMDAGESCDSACAHWQYCTITRLEYGEHRRCVESAASALAASAAPDARAGLVRLSSVSFVYFAVLALR